MKKRMLSVFLAILCVISMAIPNSLPVKADQWGITDAAELCQAFSEGGSYWLENDVEITLDTEEQLVVASSAGLQLDLQGHCLTIDLANVSGPAIRVDGNMELKDSYADSENAVHFQILNAGSSNSVIQVTKAGALTMKDVSLDAGNARTAVYVVGGDATLEGGKIAITGEDTSSENEPSAESAHWAVIAEAFEKRTEEAEDLGSVQPWITLKDLEVSAQYAGVLWNKGGRIQKIQDCNFENSLITSILNESYRNIPEDKNPEKAEEADEYLRQALIDSIIGTRIVNFDEKVIVNKGRKAQIVIDSGLFRTGANSKGHDRYYNYVLVNAAEETEDEDSLDRVEAKLIVNDGFFLREDSESGSEEEILAQTVSGKVTLPSGKKLSSKDQEFSGYEGDYVTYDDLYVGSYYRLVEGTQEESSEEESVPEEESSQEESSEEPSTIEVEPHLVTFEYVDTSYTGNTYIDGAYVEDGQKAAKPEDPSLDGYVFKGWFTDRTLQTAFDFDTPITQDTTLYASMVRRYHITFNTNGGSAIEDQYVYWTADPPETDPVREGYDFTGWYADEALNTPYDFNASVYEDLTIYAGWKEQEKEPEIYTVNFHTQGGSEIASQYVTYGDTASRPENPTREGYDFDNWYSDEALTSLYNFDTPVSAETDLYAGWTEKAPETYTVSFNTRGGSEIASQNVKDGECAVRPSEDPTREGWNLDDWYCEETLDNVFDFSTPIHASIVIYASWNRNLYEVNFDSKGGSEIEQQLIMYQYTASRPEDPTREGYDFDDWYSDEGLSTKYNFDTPVTASVTLYAGWTEKAPVFYTVSFDSKNGTLVANQDIESGKTASRPEAPSREGYDFDDWYTDEGLNTKYNFDAPVTAPITLYAGWTEKAPVLYTVTFDSKGGSSVAAQDIETGKTASRPEAPTRENYNFDDWYTDEGLSTKYNFDTPVTAAITLYAGWTLKHPEYCTVSFETKGATPVEPQTVKYGEYAVRPEQNPSIEGWTFDNWYLEASMDTVFDFAHTPITQDTVIYSSWFKNIYLVTFETNGGSAIDPKYVYHGDTASEPEDPTLKGYQFEGWYTDKELTTPYEFNTPVKKELTLYASWKKSSYTVKFDSRKGSEVAPQNVLYGDTAVRPQSPSRDGWTFDNWYADEALTKLYNFDTPVTGNLTLYASWTEKVPAKYTVNFNTRGGNSIASQTIEENHRVTKPDTPVRDGWTFERWCSDELLQNAYDFDTPVTGNLTLYASWTEKVPAKYTVSFNTRGGSDIASQTVVENHMAEKPADPTRDGWTFDRWFTDALLQNAFSFDTPITSDLTLYASWNEVIKSKYTVRFDTNGGNEVSPQSVTEGNTAFKPEEPTRTGYTFTGWYSDPECTKAYDFNAAVKENIKIYAGWKQVIPETCRVYFVTYGGSEIAPVTVKYNETVSRPANPSKNGASFDKWYANEGLTQAYDFNKPVTSDITLYAGWSEGTYKVSFATGCEQKIEAQQVKPGQTAVKPEDPVKPGFIFGGWCSDSKVTTLFSFDTPITGNTMLYAKWTSDKSTTSEEESNYESSEESKSESKAESSIEESSKEDSSKTQSVPQDSSQNTPATGDNMNIFLWIIIGLAAAVGITALVIYMKIRNRDNDDEE